MKQEILEIRIKKAYADADVRARRHASAYMKGFKARDKEQRKSLKNGSITQEQYDTWLAGQKSYMMRNEGLIKSIQYEYNYAEETAARWINGELPSAFVTGYTETGLKISSDVYVPNDIYMQGYSYNLIDKNATKVMLEHTGDVHIATYNTDGTKHKAYVDKKARQEVTQGIIAGDSVDDVAKRITKGIDNLSRAEYKSVVRSSRTLMNSAHNAGSFNAMKDASAIGIIIDKQWIATKDERTRQSHAHLDGQIVPYDKPFANGLMFPQDPNGEPAEVYNCRCTMVEVTRGFHNSVTGKTVLTDATSQEEYRKEAEEYWKKALNKNTPIIDDSYYQSQISTLENALLATNPNKVYSGIWFNDVKVSDYALKKASIQAKRDYYTNKLATETDAVKIAEYQNYLVQLDQFEIDGEAYLEAQAKLNEAKRQYSEYKKSNGLTGLANADYSQEAKNNALWFTSDNGGARASYETFAEKAGEAWNEMTPKEKECIIDYTSSYSKYNEPLRGYDYGTGNFIGIENVDYDDIGVAYRGYAKGEIKANINAMTDGIAKSTYDEDVWLNRGCNYQGMDKFFDCDMDLLRYGTTEELQAQLLGTTPTEYGFMSAGSAKATGFTRDVCLNIYCPSGTEMMYVEPVSSFGQRKGTRWDGVPTQGYTPAHENETIINRETQFEVIDIYRDNGRLYVDLQVISQVRRVL